MPPLFCCPAILPYVLLHAFRGDVQLPGVLEIPAQQLEGGGVVKAIAYALVRGEGVGYVVYLGYRSVPPHLKAFFLCAKAAEHRHVAEVVQVMEYRRYA